MRKSPSLLASHEVHHTKLCAQVGAQPRLAALKTRLTEQGRHREAWLEWIGSKHGLMARVNETLMSAYASGVAQNEAGGQLAVTSTPARSSPGDRRVGGHVMLRGVAGGGGELFAEGEEDRGGVAPAAAARQRQVESLWESERRELKSEVESLRRQVMAERAARAEAFEKLAREVAARTGGAGGFQAAAVSNRAGSPPRGWLPSAVAGSAAAVSVAAGVRRAVAAGSNSTHKSGAEGLRAVPTEPQLLPPSLLPAALAAPTLGLPNQITTGLPNLAPAPAPNLASPAELQAAYDAVCAEKAELARMLAAVKAVVPGVVASLEAGGSAPPATGDNTAVGSDSTKQAAGGPQLRAQPSSTGSAAEPEASASHMYPSQPPSPTKASYSFIPPAPAMSVSGHAPTPQQPGSTSSAPPPAPTASPRNNTAGAGTGSAGASPRDVLPASPSTHHTTAAHGVGNGAHAQGRMRPQSAASSPRSSAAGALSLSGSFGVGALGSSGVVGSPTGRPGSARLRASPARVGGAGGGGLHAAGAGAAAVFAARTSAGAPTAPSPSEAAWVAARSAPSGPALQVTATRLSTAPVVLSRGGAGGTRQAGQQ